MSVVIFLFVGYFTSGVVASALAWKFLSGKYDRKTMTDIMVLTFMLGYFSLLGLGILFLAKELVEIIQDNFDIDKFLETAKDAVEDVIEEETKV